MEYKTGDPDYVWKCHRCEELEQERDALVGLVKRIAKLEAFDFDLNGDEEWFSLPEATRKEIEK